MNDRRIYFQRANQFWEPTEDISLNAYLNVLHYVKLPIDEKLLNIALGGYIPCYKKYQLIGSRIEQEKNLAYITGLYYEEYYHDYKEAFFDNIHKNLRMRIALVIVYIVTKRGEDLGEALPVVCCGVNEDKRALIVINPFNGIYREISIDDCYEENGARKFIILNAPGMVKMKGMDKNASVTEALKLYIKRFYLFQNAYFIMDMTALEFFEYCIKERIDLKEFPDFMIHREKQLKWLHDMYGLLQEVEVKNAKPILNMLMNLYEKSIDLSYDKELNFLRRFLSVECI